MGHLSFTERTATDGADVHHEVRRWWLVQLCELEERYDELFADGRLLSGVHRRVSTLSKDGMHVEVQAWYGARLLFEIETFRAEEFGSHVEAVTLLSDCAATVLDVTESDLAKRAELKVHPQWWPELLDVLRETHRRTLDQLRTMPPAVSLPPPSYRWRLPVGSHHAAWQQLTRRCPAVNGAQPVPFYSWDNRQVVVALQDRGLRRVLVLNRLLPSHSCEIDVELLLGHRFDWVDLAGTHLTADPFDWFIHLDDYGYWDAEGWPMRHRLLQQP